MSTADYEVKEVEKNLFQLKLYDKKTKYFEAMWEIPEGVTYNAYLYLGDKVILFDGWKVGYGEELVKVIKRLTEKVDYYVVHHMEPDHSGSFPDVVRSFKPKVLGHPLVRTLATEYYGVSFDFKPVKDGEELDAGTKFVFLHTPWLHWPETTMTYSPEFKALITCDAFGSFGFEKNLRLSRKYFITVVGKYKDFVLRAAQKIKKLEVEKVYPAHGPTWDKEIIDEWLKWARGEDEEKVTLIYGSMYGFSEAIAEALEEMLHERGTEVKRFGFTDASHALASEVLTELVTSKYLIVVAPTYESGPFWPVRSVVETIAEKAKYEKRVMLVNTCGWGCMPEPYKEPLAKAGYDIRAVVTIKGRMKNEDKGRLREALEKLLS